MSNDTEKLYEAVTVAGGGSGPMTLQDARNQAEAWNDKGYEAYVINLEDDSWEDVEITAPITAEQVVDSFGADRDLLEDFMLKMFEAVDWAYDEHPDGFVVHKTKAD